MKQSMGAGPILCVNVNIDEMLDFDVNVNVDVTCEQGLNLGADCSDEDVSITLTLPACRGS